MRSFGFLLTRSSGCLFIHLPKFCLHAYYWLYTRNSTINNLWPFLLRKFQLREWQIFNLRGMKHFMMMVVGDTKNTDNSSWWGSSWESRMESFFKCILKQFYDYTRSTVWALRHWVCSVTSALEFELALQVVGDLQDLCGCSVRWKRRGMETWCEGRRKGWRGCEALRKLWVLLVKSELHPYRNKKTIKNLKQIFLWRRSLSVLWSMAQAWACTELCTVGPALCLRAA